MMSDDEVVRAFWAWADSRGYDDMREHRHSIAEMAWIACDKKYRAELAAARERADRAEAALAGTQSLVRDGTAREYRLATERDALRIALQKASLAIAHAKEST